jgi:hypothetical protein
MNRIKNKYLKLIFLLILILTLANCERELSENVEFTTFSTTGDIFTDNFVGLGSNFYFPYGPDANNPVGSKPTAWSVDTKEGYESASSMRIDVPKDTDPLGNYAGAILRIDGEGRDYQDMMP